MYWLAMSGNVPAHLRLARSARSISSLSCRTRAGEICRALADEPPARTLPFGSIETRYGAMFPPVMPNTIGVWATSVEPQAASAAAMDASTTTLRTRRG
jgi:hypothetical protein